eukprot:TRINITY_DN9153_c0_g1_i6.p1 TRINITY_DN9153_c0_g1~~TRINITY_DN9153_c0_g1_i6.p1  ORF type:complete len:156 (+),score=22.49 TRINITY_DN9153_c0_g1_i6:174-641(+)
MQRGLVGSEMCIRDRFFPDSSCQQTTFITMAGPVLHKVFIVVCMSEFDERFLKAWNLVERNTKTQQTIIDMTNSTRNNAMQDFQDSTAADTIVSIISIQTRMFAKTSSIFLSIDYPMYSALIPVSYTHLTLPTILLVQISVVAVSLKKKKLVNHY